MAKASETNRSVYVEKIKVFTSAAHALLENEKFLLKEIKKNAPDAALNKLVLSNKMLNLASNYIAISGVSWAVLKTKNEEALNDGRKSLYKAVIYLEDAVSNYIDAPFSDYEEKLQLITSFDANQRYSLVKKMGFAIDLLKQAYGDNTKWRWAFVELEGRYAAAAKNIIDLRSVYVNSSHESPYYDATVYHLRLAKKLLSQAAARYREKYELSTGETLDFKTGITFLTALKRLHIILGETTDAEEIKKKIVIWTSKYDADVKKQEAEKKKS